jgi:hypothetical protein
MPRLRHGVIVPLEQVLEVQRQLKTNAGFSLAFPLAMVPDLHRFGYLLPELQADSSNLLHESFATVEALKRLGIALHNPGHAAPDSSIPAIYTYFGQFIDHDITLEAVSKDLAVITAPDLAPLPLNQISDKIKNTRSAALDLDSVYGYPAPSSGEEMVVNRVSRSDLPRPKNKDDFNDLPRRPISTTDPRHDREALIGDPRNDENLIIAQLHVAFLRAHNEIVWQGHTFEAARRLLRQHYQWLVIEDFLKKVADPAIVQAVKVKNKCFDPAAGEFFMPLEFTVAAYRFGHSMVRASYEYNFNFFGDRAATLDDLFTFTALSGNLGPGRGSSTLPGMWIIEWERFVAVGDEKNAARRIGATLIEPLSRLRDELGQPLPPPDEARLAVRNLLRGYLLRMPTGQAVARALKLPVLSPDEILAAAADNQRDILRNAGFLERTPLWFYILAEAAHLAEATHGQKDHLGPVGSTIIAEVLIGLIRRSEDSILTNPGWTPTLSLTPGQFTLKDLLILGKVL